VAKTSMLPMFLCVAEKLTSFLFFFIVYGFSFNTDTCYSTEDLCTDALSVQLFMMHKLTTHFQLHDICFNFLSDAVVL
jgi:hypothetical protein